MNKTLKWILIGLAIAVGVFIIALPIFYMVRYSGAAGSFGWDDMPFHRGFSLPFLRFMPMMGFFGLSRLLLPLVVIGLAVYGIVALVRGKKGRTTQAPPTLPAEAAEARVCSNCGKPLPSEGEFCPHCGTKQ